MGNSDTNSAVLRSEIEDEIMAHRYLYYVEESPAVSDSTYDYLLKAAKKVLPISSAVNSLGSMPPELLSSYTLEQRELAYTFTQ